MITRPSPGVRRTRAIAGLRRPVPRVVLSANLDLSLGVEAYGLGHLRRVLMFGAAVDTQPLEHLAAQGVVLEHAAHRVGDREGGVALHLVTQRARAQAARVSRVAR